MEICTTTIQSETKTVQIGGGRPTVIIGERINPTGKKRLAEALKAGDVATVAGLARAQMQAGADVIDVNVGAAGVDEPTMLPIAVRAVMEAVDAPISIDTANVEALQAALQVYRGKALVNSVNGEESTLEQVLPLVKEYGAAVIGLTMDGAGIPNEPVKRLKIAEKIVARAEVHGIAHEDVIIDCLALTVGADQQAGRVTMESIRLAAQELGVNQVLGVSNVSFGLPDREVINLAFLSMVIANGVTCVIIDAAKARSTILAADLLLGRDQYAMRYIRDYQRRKK